MRSVGIICEYNPFHMGHRKQIRHIKEQFGDDCAVVCLMSGNYVQRGHPAIVDKTLRARAAVACGADLVLELPVTYALSSAEGFAAGAVRILSRICDGLCFGTENGTEETLLSTASELLSPAFAQQLRQRLEEGMSFPAAREAAMKDLGCSTGLLSNPNDILAVEYCKAILRQGAALQILPIRRGGNYHDEVAQRDEPSATAVRRLLCAGGSWQDFVPEETRALLEKASLHTMEAGERAVLARLRTMSEEDFEALPYGSEGLWRKLMHAARSQSSLEGILAETKSKRYTRTRLDRMVMCAFLGITSFMLEAEPPYVRILAFTDRGRGILSGVKHTAFFRNAGEAAAEPFWELEKRCGDLYGLFCVDGPEPPGTEEARRIWYARSE